MRKCFYFLICLAGALTTSAQLATNTTAAPPVAPATAGTSKAADQTVPTVDAARTKSVAVELPAISASTETKFDLDDKHILGPGDQLSFLIKEDKDLPGKPNLPVPLKVTDARDLEVPYIGRVSVKEKTCKEVAAEIKVQLEKDYYYTATVKLGLDQVNKLRGHVLVTGNVRNPGAIDVLFDEPLTVAGAIIKAGGFTDFADKKKVTVSQAARASGEGRKTIFVNVADIFEGRVEKDVALEPNDLVMVGQKNFNIK